MAVEFAKITKMVLKCLERIDSMYISVFAALEHGAEMVHGACALGKMNSAFSGLGYLISCMEPVEML